MFWGLKYICIVYNVKVWKHIIVRNENQSGQNVIFHLFCLLARFLPHGHLRGFPTPQHTCNFLTNILMIFSVYHLLFVMIHLSHWGFPTTWSTLYIHCRNIFFFRNSGILDSFPPVDPGHFVLQGTFFISATCDRHHTLWMFHYVLFQMILKHFNTVLFQ